MALDSSPTVLRRWIGLELRRLREQAGRSRPEAAARLRVSRAAIGHMETARTLPSAAALEILLGYYGVPDRLEELHDLAESARRRKEWWRHLAGAAPSGFDLFLGLEAGASEIVQFELSLIPGLLQTPDYSRAVMRANPDLSEETVEQRVALRQGRQAVLDREPDPPHYTAMIDEAVLMRRRGAPSVMRAQMEHMLEAADRPTVTLLVVPLGGGAAYLAQNCPFQLLRFPEGGAADRGLVYLETRLATHYHDDPSDVGVYDRLADSVREVAHGPNESLALIRRHADTWGSTS